MLAGKRGATAGQFALDPTKQLKARSVLDRVETEVLPLPFAFLAGIRSTRRITFP